MQLTPNVLSVTSTILLRKTHHRGTIVNEDISIGSNSYKKVKTFKYLGSLVTNHNSIQDEINVDLKQEFHVIIQSKHTCLLDFSLKI